MKYSVKTDIGIQREKNQDSCFAGNPDASSCFAIVCDGMGGANAGEIASAIAVKTVSERVMDGWRKNITAESVENLLTSAISAANICVFDEACADSGKSGMGTTVVAAAVVGNECVIAHAGDSRAYLISDGIKRLTKDHSYVQTLVDSGIITDEQAEHHPKKNFITRALGVGEHIDIDFLTINVKQGDKLLLCSDGLTNFVSEENICVIVSENSVDAASETLIGCANTNGGGDNITVAVIEI